MLPNAVGDLREPHVQVHPEAVPEVFGRRPVDRAHVPAVVGADDLGRDPVPGPEVLGEEDRGEDAVHVRAQYDADALFKEVVDADRAQDARLQERFPHAYKSSCWPRATFSVVAGANASLAFTAQALTARARRWRRGRRCGGPACLGSPNVPRRR